MNQEQLKFHIDQLRKDKIIYATEAAATNLLMLVVLYFSSSHFTGDLRTVVDRLALIIAAGYTLYMGVGNFMRLRKIKELGGKLSK